MKPPVLPSPAKDLGRTSQPTQACRLHRVGTSVCPWINLRFDLDYTTKSFEAWYDNVRETLDEDVAVHLQEQIDELETKHSHDVNDLNSTIANLAVQNQQLQTQLDNERKYDNVIKKQNY